MVNKFTNPKKPLRITALFRDFFANNQAGGILLIVATVLSLILANSGFSELYNRFWKTEIGPHLSQNPLGIHWHLRHSVTEWVNDGLMTLFFLLVGLEIERELYIGELSDRKRAMLPIWGALGGMIVPAVLFLVVTATSPELRNGAGIPTATDIAFAIAILGLLGDRVPPALKVFLTALAIIDDLGAIFVIALFYGSGFSSLFLCLSAAILCVLFVLNKKCVTNGWLYAALGFALWFCMLHSGIHATLAGVILAFAIPFENGNPTTLSYRLEHALQKPVAFFILPLFALANTAIPVNHSLSNLITSPVSLGIFAGLVLGKPLGIVSFSLISNKLGFASLSRSIGLKQLIGAGILGGIGFTMAIFVANLAYSNPELIDTSKIAILISSTSAACLGYLILKAR